MHGEITAEALQATCQAIVSKAISDQMQGSKEEMDVLVGNAYDRWFAAYEFGLEAVVADAYGEAGPNHEELEEIKKLLAHNRQIVKNGLHLCGFVW